MATTATTTKLTPAQSAQNALNAAKEAGFTLSVSGIGAGNFLHLSKSFTPGDNAAFVQCDGDYYHVMAHVKMVGSGSIWGTDGSGMGGAVALRNGQFKMNKSQCSANVLKALVKLGVTQEQR